ncbi:MAG TPA: hypothetical protein VD993_03515 [Chitinophagaceae bacterium]|nr:hypothetical protein [Chitinophagaceae bacterium]
MKKTASFTIFLLSGLLSFSQTITGSWYGRADVDMEGLHDNYLTELILKQKGDEVEGVFGYYFKNMYQSVFIRGTYDKRTRQVYIKNIPVIHYRSNVAQRLDCPMDFEGTLMVSKAKSSLQGFFLRQAKYKYTCPDIRVNYTLDGNELNQDSILRNTVAGVKVWSPLPDDVVYTQTTTANTAKDIAPEANNAQQELVTRYEARKNILQQEITVSSDSLRISFYDNGDIDGDSISVFMNGSPVLARKELDVRGLNLYVKLDSTKAVNEISMFAENLGKFPPNTALMVVYDGDARKEIYLSSSFTQNASVRIKRKK